MSSSSSSASDGNGGEAHDEFEGPPRARPRGVNEVWPEPFLESLAVQIAIDASRRGGRLSAAQALANVFQVCSTWRAVSRSDLLWRRLTHHIWGVNIGLLRDTWREEYIYRHRTTFNFRTGQYVYFTLHFDPSDVDDPNDPDALNCRCLALSELYLACGYTDGAVRLFSLATRLHVRTYRPQPRDDHVGQFSRAVSGILISDTRLVFASIDGDIHVAAINGNSHTRRVQLGDVYSNGLLVDFTGCSRFWVGLYAGASGRAFHIWDGNTEDLIFIGGTLTDPAALTAWRMLTELIEPIGRVRVTSRQTVIACTNLRTMSFDLGEQTVLFDEEESVLVTSFDVHNEAYMVVDERGVARVRRVDTLEDLCRRFRAGQRTEMGCMNGGYAVICVGGVIRVWEIETRRGYLYSLRERIGEVNALVADDRHVAAIRSDSTIHLWDFGAE